MKSIQRMVWNSPRTQNLQTLQAMASGINTQEAPKRLKPLVPHLQNSGWAPIQRVRVPRSRSSDIHELLTCVINNDKRGFKRKFRGMAPGMDEEISCQVTFSRARQMYLGGRSLSSIRHLLRTSHRTRLPTSMTAHYVRMPDGRVRRMIHPTSTASLLYGAPFNARGNPRWVGHTSFDRARAAYVSLAVRRRAMRDRAIEYSLNYGSQPPFARNAVAPPAPTDPAAIEAHNDRERLKSRHSRFDPSQSQPHDADWEPGRRSRGVSPSRGRL